MKEKVIVTRDSVILYEGRIIELPFKESFIVARSIEIFNDEDPCIIHQSYIIKELVSDLLALFEKTNDGVLSGAIYKSQLAMLNFVNIETISISLVG